MAGKNLQIAMNEKYAEFYTRLSDIEMELSHYTKHFKGKTVLCNCDDPFESNFPLYFLMNFNYLGLKRLISIGYSGSNIANTKLVKNGVYCLDISDTKHCLQGDQTDLDAEAIYRMLDTEDECIHIIQDEEEYLAGDFRSETSRKFLEEADIVVGNPPFPLFREYFLMLQKYKKKFLIIGNMNAITYKEFFPYIQKNDIWVGATNFNTGMYFYVREDFTYRKSYKFLKELDGRPVNRVPATAWYTNLDYTDRHELLRLGNVYKGHESDYPEYDNYKAVDIGRFDKNGARIGDASRIPYDYTGLMGVPISSLNKLCPEQFEIMGLAPERSENMVFKTFQYLNGVEHHKDGSTKAGNKVNDGPCLLFKDEPPKKFPWYTADNREGYLQELYARILIKAKQPGRNDWDAWQREIDEKYGRWRL